MPRLTPDEIARRHLGITHPDLAAQWHPTLNGDLTPNQVTEGSGKTVHWQCHTPVTWPDGTQAPCGHVWPAKIANRATLGHRCPGCMGRDATPWNRLDILRPDLAADWNDPRDITTVPIGSAYTAQWRCHTCTWEWPKAVEKRTQSGYGCPACAGKVATPWRNAATEHPHLVAEWHPDNTHPLSAYTPGANDRAHWRCPNPVEVNGEPAPCGYEWTATINSRTQGRGCAACSGKAAAWWNNLAIRRPDLAAQWHPTNNGDLTPTQVTPGAKTKAWWRCDATYTGTNGESVPCEYEWDATVDNRNRGRGCPACAGSVLSDRNRLSRLRPDLVQEWHEDNDRSPDEVSVGNDYVARWRCTNVSTATEGIAIQCGFVWPTMVRNRTLGQTECPACRLANASRDEIHLAHELALFLPVKMDRERILTTGSNRGWSADICVPDHRLIIEYDGAYWHREREAKDEQKTRALEAEGWIVLRVREEPLAPLGTHAVIAVSGRYKETADTVLLYLRDRLRFDLPGLDAYVDADGLQNAEEARDHIARLLQGQLANAAKRTARAGQAVA